MCHFPNTKLHVIYSMLNNEIMLKLKLKIPDLESALKNDSEKWVYILHEKKKFILLTSVINYCIGS